MWERIRRRPRFVNLREFCLFWVEERAHYTCCQFADEEQLANEPDLFNCQTCPVAEAIDGLHPENAEAWALFRRVVGRLVIDAGLASETLRRLTQDLSAADFADTLDRLTLIYDVVMPERKPTP